MEIDLIRRNNRVYIDAKDLANHMKSHILEVQSDSRADQNQKNLALYVCKAYVKWLDTISEL